MKRLSSLMILLFATLCLTACGGGEDPHEAAIEDMLDVMNDFDGVLAGVTDVDSANALESKLDGISERLEAWSVTMKNLEEPSEEKQKELEEKFKPRMEELKKKMAEHIERLAKLGPEVMLPTIEAMGKVKPSEEMPKWME
ncbi:MAG: hypothetical protein AB8C95_05580 [Phycisphaeraceae bacterium]